MDTMTFEVNAENNEVPYYNNVLRMFKNTIKKAVEKSDNPNNPIIISAGYADANVPDSEGWFRHEGWGRDTFISIFGSLFVDKRFNDVKMLIKAYAKKIQNGIIPNRIHPDGRAEYNNADGSLHWIRSIKQYVDYSGDYDFLNDPEIIGGIRDIISWYRKGTGYNKDKKVTGTDADKENEIIMTIYNLLYSPAQASWMDADPNGTGAITPRNGYAVEINAMMYEAISYLAFIETDQNSKKELYELAAKMKKAFIEKFWNKGFKADKNGIPENDETPLFDVIEGDPQGADVLTVRPNMLYAVLAGDLLSDYQKKWRVSDTSDQGRRGKIS